MGRQRLRSLLLEAESTGEAWSLLPAPEDVDSAVYAVLDGRPALIVVTTNAGRIGIFEKKKLRVYALEADRTQAGHAPLLAERTTSHRWLPVSSAVADVDREGADDLVALKPEGMGGGELVVETFFGRGKKGLSTPGRHQRLEVESVAAVFGHDLSGDGIADLAVLDTDSLVASPAPATPGARCSYGSRSPTSSWKPPAPRSESCAAPTSTPTAGAR
jgi:hypothetical protein